MEKIIALLKKLGIELTADQTKQLEEVGAKELVSAADAAKTATELEELKKQLEELTAKYNTDTEELNKRLAAQETDFAAERFISGFEFASDRVRSSVLDDFKKQGFKLKDGKFLGGEDWINQLRESEPDAFAQEKQNGLLMGSTQSNVGIDANNLEAQIMNGFGLAGN